MSYKIYDSKGRYINRRRQQAIFRRFMSFIAAIILIGTLSSVSIMIINAKDNEEEPIYKYYTSIIVYRGDTLEDIAKEHLLGYDSVSDYCKEVRRMNYMNDNELVVGQSLIIPYYSFELK